MLLEEIDDDIPLVYSIIRSRLAKGEQILFASDAEELDRPKNPDTSVKPSPNRSTYRGTMGLVKSIEIEHHVAEKRKTKARPRSIKKDPFSFQMYYWEMNKRGVVDDHADFTRVSMAELEDAVLSRHGSGWYLQLPNYLKYGG
jgi:hypothetical protein